MIRVPVISPERAENVLTVFSQSLVGCPRLGGGKHWLYFALAPDQFVKVGFTKNPPKRMGCLRSYYSAEGLRPLVFIRNCCAPSERSLLCALSRHLRSERAGLRSREFFSLRSPVLGIAMALRSCAEAEFFDNKLAGYDRGPIKHCTLCNSTAHNAARCERRPPWLRRAA